MHARAYWFLSMVGLWADSQPCRLISAEPALWCKVPAMEGPPAGPPWPLMSPSMDAPAPGMGRQTSMGPRFHAWVIREAIPGFSRIIGQGESVQSDCPDRSVSHPGPSCNSHMSLVAATVDGLPPSGRQASTTLGASGTGLIPPPPVSSYKHGTGYLLILGHTRIVSLAWSPLYQVAASRPHFPE